jgi:hypothetical protein
MKGWIKYPETIPQHDISAIVSNEKGWMSFTRAIYYHSYDVWILYDPNYIDTITLQVTHYLPCS